MLLEHISIFYLMYTCYSYYQLPIIESNIIIKIIVSQVDSIDCCHVANRLYIRIGSFEGPDVFRRVSRVSTIQDGSAQAADVVVFDYFHIL